MQKNTLDRLTAIAGIVTIASATVGLLSYLPKHLDSRIVFLLAAPLLGGIVWLALSAFRASKSFDSRAPLPWPQWLWPLLFDRLPAMAGLLTDPTQRASILVVFDSTSSDILKDLKENYIDEHVEIRQFDCSDSDDLPAQREELDQLMSGADAVYMIWTREMKDLGWPANSLSQWAYANSFKPILVVNTLLDEPYELPYVSLPKSKAASGLWRLLARSSERGRQWRLRASSNRRAFIISMSLLAMLALYTTSIYLENRQQKSASQANEAAMRARIEAKEDSEKLDVALMRNNADELWSTTESSRTALDQMAAGVAVGAEQKEGIHKTLNGFADFLEKSLESYSPVGRAVGSVTFWRRVELDEEVSRPNVPAKECVCEIAWSDGEKQTCFKYDERSIAGCAFKNKIQVLYRSGNSSSQLPGAWNSKGIAVGSWENSMKLLANNGSFSCFYDDSENTNTSHTNLFCTADVPRGGRPKDMSGVCVETILESELLESARVRQILSNSLTALHVLPESLIADEGAIKECKKRWK